MSLLDRLEGRETKSAATPLDLFREIYGGRLSKAGYSINWRTATRVSAVLACARVIAEGIAQVPFKLYRESADGRTRLPAKEHPLYRLLFRRPNFFQTSFEYRETMVMHAALAHGHFSFINRMPGSGRILSLLPFEPQHVTVKRDPKTRELKYHVRPDEGDPAVFGAEHIWHVRGPSWNGYDGLDAIDMAREAIGLSLSTEEQHAKLHKNSAQVGGVVSVEGALTDKQYKELRGWLDKYFEGVKNEHAGRTMLLDRGAKFHSQTMTGVDAQHLETRRNQVEEICRFMRVMPIMVGHSDKAATYASAEQMFLAHVVHTLSPWYERIEQSADVNLLSERDQESGLYAKFIEEGLLRGALKDTKDYLVGLVNGGLMTPNEGRAKLDLNPDSDPASDRLRIPVNTVNDPADKPDPEKEKDS
jgi:HK97 family phage portal protein